MPRLNLFAAVGLLLLGPMAGALAADNVLVPAGVKTRLGFIAIFDPNTCGHAAKPGVKITQPKNGKLSVVWMNGKIESRGSCNGRTSKGLVMFLTMDRGFRGVDRAGVNVTYAGRLNGSDDTSRYLPLNIRVK